MKESENSTDYKFGGYHPVFINEVYHSRYKILQQLGFGYFSTVWLCLDLKENIHVALKIQKSAPQYMDAAMDEIEIILKIHRNSSHPKWNLNNRIHIIKILNHFMHKGPNGSHVCIIFDILGADLAKIMEFYEFKGCPLDLCKNIMKQCLLGLDYLHRICAVIHTDIKPENILVALNESQISELVFNGKIENPLPMIKEKQVYVEETKNSENSRNSRKINEKREKKREYQGKLKEKRKKRRGLLEIVIPIERIITKIDPNIMIKIIDFGNACWITKHFSAEIQSLLYRSPEVILGIPYNQTADIWSLGCVFFELIVGSYLFAPMSEDNFIAEEELLTQIWETCGPESLKWGIKGKHAKKFLNSDGSLKIISKNTRNIKELIQERGISEEEALKIERFLKRMIEPNLEKRAQAFECLEDPWINEL